MPTSHRVAMLGTGLIGDFYTMTLHGRRGRDQVQVVYSRTEERGAAFQERWGIPASSTLVVAAGMPHRRRNACPRSSVREYTTWTWSRPRRPCSVMV